jgi:hypothetical protein
MPTILIRHRVADFAKWKLVLDDESPSRKANGSCGERIFRSAVDPNEVLVLMEWDDIERAHLFVRSADLSDAMVRAEVTDRPDIWFLKEANRPPF